MLTGGNLNVSGSLSMAREQPFRDHARSAHIVATQHLAGN
jgi:hypothetical protein